MITVAEAKRKMNGVVIPLATIFKDNGDLDIDGTARNIQWIVDQGAKPGNTVFIACGSGGDFTVLTPEERKAVIKVTAEIANKAKIPTFASAQSTDIRTTIDLCQHCEKVGIDMVQMSSAYYYDVKQGDFLAWVKEVAKHTKIGFAAYSHWYSGSKYDMTMEVAEKMMEIPNCVAVKWASPNIGNYIAGLKYFIPRAAVVNNGPLQTYGYMLGAKAWVSHVPNFYPQHSWKVHELLTAGRFQEADALLSAFEDPYWKLNMNILNQTAGEGVFVKPWMEAAGLRGGTSRLPSRPEVATPELRKEMAKLIEKARELVAKTK